MKIYISFFLGLIMIVFNSFIVPNKIKVVNFEELEPFLHKNNDTIYIINFWASWCLPCVDELPAFEKISKKYHKEKVKVLLVSLDFPSQIESHLIPFIKKHNLQSDIIVLDDPDSNSWINKVSPEWTGTIPATIIYNRNFRKFYERSFTFPELDSIVKLKM